MISKQSNAVFKAAGADPIEALLRELVTEVRGLRADLRTAGRQTATGSTSEPVDPAEFLATIADSVKGHPFTAGELLAHAAVDVDLAHALQGVTTARQLGKRLQVLADRTINSLRLERISRDATGLIWLVQVVDLQSDAGHDGDGGV